MEYWHDLSRLESREQLITALGIPAALFDAILAFEPPIIGCPVSDPTITTEIGIPLFIRHDIPKKNKTRGNRTVWEPLLNKSHYKALARRLGSFFRLKLDQYPHDSVYGYMSGRNIRENAKAHTGHRVLLSIDIQDFFPSITTESVCRLFQSLGVNATVSGLLSRFLTIGTTLPLGFPTSPIISNAIALPIDLELKALADLIDATYTRYADDLSFSSNGKIPDVEEVRAILGSNGFKIADAKTRQSKIGQAHYVTGLSISDPLRPHVPRERKHSLRRELYFARKFGLADHLRHRGVNDDSVIQQEINRIDGFVKFVAHHEPRMAADLKTGWREILLANGAKPSFTPRGQYRAPFYIFIDEAEYVKTGHKILALGMTVTQHAQELISQTSEVLSSARADLWAAGNTEILLKKGLHFSDATEDLRLEYVKRLAAMPFEGYVAFAPCKSPADYEATYLRLLSALIPRRLMAAESQFVFIYCEENSKISRDEAKAKIQRAFDDLKASNNRHPKGFAVEFVSKPNLGISAPDFLLGVLGTYLRSEPSPLGKPEPRERLMFERLRDKYRLILDVETWTEYSRRRPIEPW
ncbi:reverse transcriptase family protein [Phyllobacterium chamaecytisi]|uniref:reverse transcriptase family protein n=1 Tax=Phyllobacterium chamaecytisi TaxID=2876082 RepID=UPI001CCF8B84|nr:reverse transcriptase family protein [Phyllobacterium sp. KW56]MBZ9605048.1 reverse transcriptase family protein [Phyllobacterium sp. KW56]